MTVFTPRVGRHYITLVPFVQNMLIVVSLLQRLMTAAFSGRRKILRNTSGGGGM